MKTGIIMEVNDRFLTLLTPEGEFLRARKQDSHYQIGQEIDFFPIELDKPRNTSFLSFFSIFKGKTIFTAALAIMLAVISFLPFYGSNDVYAYMSIDINPSIELGVNEKYEVIELIPYNEEGKLIVEKIKDWKNKDIHLVTGEIIQEIKKQGYTKDNHEIVIATVYTEEERTEDDKRWKEEMAEIKEVIQKEQLDLKVVEGTTNDREKAKEKGLTTGLYKEKSSNTSSEKETSSNIKRTLETEKKKEETANNDISNTPLGQIKKLEKKAEKAKRKAEKEKKEKEKAIPSGQAKQKERANRNDQQKAEKKAERKADQKNRYQNTNKHEGRNNRDHQQKFDRNNSGKKSQDNRRNSKENGHYEREHEDHKRDHEKRDRDNRKD